MIAVKIARYVLLNPVGIAIAFVHWIVVLYAMLGDVPDQPIGLGIHWGSTELWYYLLMINLPALLLSYLISTPIIYLFNLADWASFIFSITAIGAVTLQWLLVGAVIQSLISERNIEERRPNKITDDGFAQ